MSSNMKSSKEQRKKSSKEQKKALAGKDAMISGSDKEEEWDDGRKRRKSGGKEMKKKVGTEAEKEDGNGGQKKRRKGARKDSEDGNAEGLSGKVIPRIKKKMKEGEALEALNAKNTANTGDTDTSWEGSEDERKGVSLEMTYVRRKSPGRNIGRGKVKEVDSEGDESERGSERLLMEGTREGIIYDKEVEGVLKKHYKHNVDMWPGKIDLSPKEDEYCREEEREAKPELHPPFLYTGENCRPRRLAELLMGEECRQFQGGSTVWMNKDYHKIGRAKRYHEISDALMLLFKANANMELFYVKEDKNPAGASKARWEANKHVTYFCEACYNGSKKKDLIAVVRVELKEEMEGENIRCFFQILECFFHSCKCYKSRGEEKFDNSEVQLLKVEGSVFMDQVRKGAFENWIKELRKIKTSTGNGPVTRITLNSKEPHDARYQWRIQKASDVPPTIDKGKLAQILAWDLFRVLKERNMVDGFTRHIPVSYAVKRKGGKVKPGEWPLNTENAMPIHLYMRGCYLIWGGYSLDEKGYISEEIGLDQIPHTDFGKTGFLSADECPLLNGLAHPCTFNTPIEDYRELYTCDGANERKHWKVKMNELLVLHADTIHGGKSYVYDQKYHPSRHGAVESLRYPQKKGTDAVSLTVGPQTYMPPKFIVSMSDRGVELAVQRLMFKDLKPLVEDITNANRVIRSSKTMAMVMKLKEVFDEAEKYQCESEEEVSENGVGKGILESESESVSESDVSEDTMPAMRKRRGKQN